VCCIGCVCVVCVFECASVCVCVCVFECACVCVCVFVFVSVFVKVRPCVAFDVLICIKLCSLMYSSCEEYLLVSFESISVSYLTIQCRTHSIVRS
jgi:hypothetical protein